MVPVIQEKEIVFQDNGNKPSSLGQGLKHEFPLPSAWAAEAVFSGARFPEPG